LSYRNFIEANVRNATRDEFEWIQRLSQERGWPIKRLFCVRSPFGQVKKQSRLNL
jgi:hypothetical protein